MFANLRLMLLLIPICGLIACSAAPIGQADPIPTLARLPSVTPVLPTVQATPSLQPTQRLIATAQPTPISSPTPTEGIRETADGPVTPSMARLRIGAEPYATLGDPRAPITVIEFADFGCAFCRQYHLLTFGSIKTEYIDTGKVYYVFKDLPVTSQHGALAAQAAECAGAQGRYWDMHDGLFRQPEVWYGDVVSARARIDALTAELGLDGPGLTACLEQEQQLANIDRNFAEAQNLRLYGTPAFLINAKLLAGAQPIAVWREVLDRALGE